MALRVKWMVFWLIDLMAVLEFLLRRRRPKSGLTILCYHRTVGGLPQHPPFDPFNVSPATFCQQLAALRSLPGTTLTTAGEVAEWIERGSVRDGAYLMLTFDDGYQNVLEAATQLHREGWPAVFFVATGYIGQPTFDFCAFDRWCTNQSDPRWYKPVTLDDCRRLLQLGMEIQPHGHMHRRLGQLPQAEIEDEIRSSKAVVQEALGRKVIAFAYPYGSPYLKDFSRSVEGSLSEAGIQFAVSTEIGRNDVRTLRLKSYQLRRIPVQEYDRGVFFQAKAAGYCALLRFVQAVIHKIKARRAVCGRALFATREPGAKRDNLSSPPQALT